MLTPYGDCICTLQDPLESKSRETCRDEGGEEGDRNCKRTEPPRLDQFYRKANLSQATEASSHPLRQNT